jgi:hypothetical protein
MFASGERITKPSGLAKDQMRGPRVGVQEAGKALRDKDLSPFPDRAGTSTVALWRNPGIDLDHGESRQIVSFGPKTCGCRVSWELIRCQLLRLS